MENGNTDLANLSDQFLVVIAGTICMPAPGLAEAGVIVAIQPRDETLVVAKSCESRDASGSQTHMKQLCRLPPYRLAPASFRNLRCYRRI